MVPKMKRIIVFFCAFLYCHCKENEREPKFFFNPKEETSVSYRRISHFVTDYYPSSCIVIDATLPPCRHVRKLEIHPSVPTRIAKTQGPQTVPEKQKRTPVRPSVEVVNHIPTPPLPVKPQPTNGSWSWNLFNLFRAPETTKTVTMTEYVTTKIEDKNTVVSFYVKGCRPSKLPFNLTECSRPELPLPTTGTVKRPLPNPKPDNKSVVVVAPVKFVSTVNPITPSKVINSEKNEDEQVEDHTVSN